MEITSGRTFTSAQTDAKAAVVSKSPQYSGYGY
jgi:hypothetical protein